MYDRLRPSAVLRTTMSRQLLEAVETAYLKKDFIHLHELVPQLLKRIKNLEASVELMSRLTDNHEGTIEKRPER
jgi:hypothetical protein